MRFQELGCGRGHRISEEEGRDVTIPAEGPAGRGRLAEWLVEVGLEIVHEVRGPVRLWDFSQRLKTRLGMPPIPPGRLCDAVKAALTRTDDPRLRVLAPGMEGVGYVWDAEDVDSWPVRHSW